MRARASMSDHHLAHKFQELVHDIRRVGNVRKDTTTLDNEIANEIEKNCLRPKQVLAVLPTGCDNFERADIEYLLRL